MKIQITAYLMFNGNCKEAMAFYKDCIGGELTMQTVGETPACNEMPAEAKNSIMHAALMRDGEILLMASDNLMGSEYIHGTTTSLALNCRSEEEINSFFKKLSNGGKVIMPLADQFWGATFGLLTDKYGFNWMLNFQKEEKKS